MIAALVAFGACGRGVPEGARVVVAGDSVMAWNRIDGQSVADVLSARLGQSVGDVSLPLAQVTGGRGALNIPNQLRGVNADWIVLNGGANDLGVGCDCTDCDAVVDGLIGPDGQTGAIPALVKSLRAKGSRVVWADYYTSPRYAGTACTGPYQTMEDRLYLMAAADDGISVVDMEDVLSPDQTDLFDADRLHPSPAGSKRIGNLIADQIPALAQP